MGACHRRPLSLLSVRRGWAIGSPIIVDEAVGMWLGFSLPGCCSLGNHVDIHLGEGDGDTSAVKGFFYGHKNLVSYR